MEPMDGDQGLESVRSTSQASGGQSTDINAEEPWTFTLEPSLENNRQETPKLDVQFNTRVQVHGLKLQGKTDENLEFRFVLSVWDSSFQTFNDVQDSSGEPLVSTNN